jgi:uncharacterized membrane protein YhaH (DUF805 family)|tara:strand:+ start:789 stop:1091 length:303 start_codon:yes stop_codon:yes gene_type:complete
MKYIITPFKKMFNIKDKANIKEFWTYFTFLIFLISPLIGFIDGLSVIHKNYIIAFNIFFLIQFTTLGFRRLNETKFNKWLFLIPIVNLILAAFPPETENN